MLRWRKGRLVLGRAARKYSVKPLQPGSHNLEIAAIASIGIKLSRQQTIKALLIQKFGTYSISSFLQ